jgi:hypothetical protein
MTDERPVQYRRRFLSRDPDIVSFRYSLRGVAWQTDREESPRIYAQLSFLAYYLNCPCLDTEWLLSTLFDASLLSTLKPPETAALFFGTHVFFWGVRDR